jgi:hypothetical protein
LHKPTHDLLTEPPPDLEYDLHALGKGVVMEELDDGRVILFCQLCVRSVEVPLGTVHTTLVEMWAPHRIASTDMRI